MDFQTAVLQVRLSCNASQEVCVRPSTRFPEGEVQILTGRCKTSRLALLEQETVDRENGQKDEFDMRTVLLAAYHSDVVSRRCFCKKSVSQLA